MLCRRDGASSLGVFLCNDGGAFFWLGGLFLVMYSISSLIYLWCISCHKGLHEKVCKSITFLRVASKSHCKADTMFMTWLANPNYVIQLKPSGSPNNMKLGVNN